MTAKTGRSSFSSSSAALLAVPYSVTHGESRNFDLSTASHITVTESSTDPAYLFSQLKSAEWIQRYGLKSQKLTFDQILQQIGFKRVESFNPTIGKTISAKYASNLYHEVQHDNGDRYVLTCRPEKLREYHHRLNRMLNLLRKRLQFITNGSRRLFGIIGEPSVCLICDCKTLDHRIFNQFQTALTSLFKEQITKIKRFNIIWVSNDNEPFRDQPVDVTSSNIDQAIDWICDQKCSRKKASLSATCEAVLKAFDNTVHSIYLITEGDSSDSAREMLRDNIVKTRLASNASIPLHVISLFCHSNDTQTFLRSIAQSAEGSYFCYKIKSEVSDLKASSNLTDPTRIKLQDDKLQIGTNALTPIPEYPVDITLMYKEIIQCQNVIDRIEKILGFIREETQNTLESFATKSLDGFNSSGEHQLQRSLVVQSSALFSNEENDMSSADWLKIYGIDAQKLDFFSVLHAAAFRHCDGVVTLLKPPNDSEEVTESTPAIPEDKLVNAIYCDQFAHVAWPDGTIRHVHVTPELHRDYERRIRALIEKIKARLSWLKKGSRDVFGTVLENNIYVLIDTSKSMEHHLGFLKEKLRLLIQDQLLAKERVNMVAFNSILIPWRDRLTKINDSTTTSQLYPWINGLHAEGSTNTLAALRFALADSATEAIYLLTDGRPDQNERHILSQVQYRQSVPIHTIAFNCLDREANQFLYDLAKQTGGRFHAFKYGLEKESTIELPESEDVGNLRQEYMRGVKELERIAALRDECLSRAWPHEKAQMKTSKYKREQTSIDLAALQLKSHSTLDIGFRPSSATMYNRTSKKKRSTIKHTVKKRSRSVTNLAEHHSILNINPEQWLLPETEAFLHGKKTEQEKSDSDTNDHRQVTPTVTKKTPLPYTEVKSYLRRKSLVAQALTIFDVLHPISVTVKEPRHIQVIDRHVLAKVWDDILPVTYGSYVGKLRLINHYAVDLEKYEGKLKELIASYYIFTTKFVWKHLSDEAKLDFARSRHWNNLSKDDQTRLSQEISKEEHTSQSALESFAWRKLTDDEQKTELEKAVPYQDTNQNKLKEKLKDTEAYSVLKGVNRMDVEIHRATKFLQISTDLRQLQKRADTNTKPPDKITIIKKIIKPPVGGISPGQRVIVLYINGFFYPGTIRVDEGGILMVYFEMGIIQPALGCIILPIGGARAQPPLVVNDFVLVRLTNDRGEYWAPGIVIVLPSTQSSSLYTIKIHNPGVQQVDASRRDIFKIPLSIFQQSIIFIQRNSPPVTPVVDPNIQKQLEELISKLNKLDKSQHKHYHQLKIKLEEQRKLIIDLQGRRHADNKDEKTQAPEISVELSIDPPPSNPLPSPSPRPRKDVIQRNTDVYAAWFDDDCFVYEGRVSREGTHLDSYIVRRADLPSHQSEILRGDIFLNSDRTRLIKLPLKKFVLIECRDTLRGGWKPAVILSRGNEQTDTSVRFYDCIDARISNNENVIPITEEQFARYTELRIQYEKACVNRIVVGLNAQAQMFMLGTVIERLSSGHEFTVHWCDDSKSPQDEENLFGTTNRCVRFEHNNRVLAMDDAECIYKAARVKRCDTNSASLVVQFDDNNREVEVPTKTTFPITEAYYHKVIRTLHH